MRQIVRIDSAPSGHWVGDGFPVRSLFSHQSHGPDVSPFLLFDYAGPATFPPADHPRGVGQHPHRGFETVTIVYDGELDHRDSTGAGGRIGPGDVQWMTAASGVIHEEYHSQAFTRSGGPFEVVQLWVNLPARDKMSAPAYQTLLDKDIPVVELPDGAGRLRVVGGDYAGHKGAAHSFTPVDIWDVRLRAGKSASFTLPEGHTLVVVVLSGAVEINGEQTARDAEAVTFAREGGGVTFDAKAETKLLVLSGEPIDEPIVAQGPFVMNTADEIRQAFSDYQSGRFGAIAAE